MHNKVVVAPNYTMARRYGEKLGVHHTKTFANSPMGLRGLSLDVRIYVVDGHLLSEETLNIIEMLSHFGNTIEHINSRDPIV